MAKTVFDLLRSAVLTEPRRCPGCRAVSNFVYVPPSCRCPVCGCGYSPEVHFFVLAKPTSPRAVPPGDVAILYAPGSCPECGEANPPCRCGRGGADRPDAPHPVKRRG